MIIKNWKWWFQSLQEDFFWLDYLVMWFENGKKEKVTGFVIQWVIFQAKWRRFFMSGSWDFLPLHIQSSGQFPDLLIGFRQKRESNGVNNSLKLGIKLSKVGMEHYFSRLPSSAFFELPIWIDCWWRHGHGVSFLD